MLDLYHLDKALVRRAQIDPESASIVELRYFGESSRTKPATVLGVPLQNNTVGVRLSHRDESGAERRLKLIQIAQECA